MNNLSEISVANTENKPPQSSSKTGYQCGSCEQIFYEDSQKNVRECPHCGSGNFCEGYIDGGEIAPLAEEKICVDCGEPTTDIPRIDYTIEDNSENGFAYPAGGYMCNGCENRAYAEAHLDGDSYCPTHGFCESYLNMKDENDEYIGCYDDCPDAAEYDRSVREEYGAKSD